MDRDNQNDCDVDGFDFLKWQANYGMVATLSASSAAVPEPATCGLALVATLLLAIGGRSR